MELSGSATALLEAPRLRAPDRFIPAPFAKMVSSEKRLLAEEQASHPTSG